MTHIATRDAKIISSARHPFVLTRVRAYFASDSRRTLQTVLGLIWLLDGALQFQSFMYSQGFVQLIQGNAAGQPHWLASSINWGTHLLQLHLALLNTLAALTQVVIGVGLLYRGTVKAALALSFLWSLNVWWIGEGFGLLFNNSASPLTGAPGAVVLYVILGLMVWPTERSAGLLGVRGARAAWATLWLMMAWMWLLVPNSTANATHDQIGEAPSGARWLTSIEHGVANGAKGNGLLIALILALVSAAIGVAVAANWHPKPFLAAAIILNVAYWVVGQGLGGIFTGSATDPNAGLLFIVLAAAMYFLTPIQGSGTEHRSGPYRFEPERRHIGERLAGTTSS
jgi:hypothetical protein